MYLKSDSVILDFDIDLLKDVLSVLEETLVQIDNIIKTSMKESIDAESLGLFDKGEHVIGLAFTACQKYISSTFRQSGFEKQSAIKLGPNHHSGESYVKIINAVANYWKHCDEWDTVTKISNEDNEVIEIILRDYERLASQSKNTINTIEKVTSWADYTCSNVLASITSTEKISVLALLPLLVEWRNALINSSIEPK